jgi:hypothetical protein
MNMTGAVGGVDMDGDIMDLEQLMRSDTLNVVMSARLAYSSVQNGVVTLYYDNAQNLWVVHNNQHGFGVEFLYLKDALEFFVSTIEELPIDKGSTK